MDKKEYRRWGIASQLMCKSLKALDNPKPKVTVSEKIILSLKLYSKSTVLF